MPRDKKWHKVKRCQTCPKKIPKGWPRSNCPLCCVVLRNIQEARQLSEIPTAAEEFARRVRLITKTCHAKEES